MSFHYTPIADYQRCSFAAKTSQGHEITHDVYTRGEGAPIVLIQELPGIGKETLRLADKFVAHGFKVVMPHLFGPLERTSVNRNLIRVLFCMRKEFHLFASQGSSPIVDWLRALCRHVRQQEQVPGVGVIGMCLTGNFAISLIGDDNVLAAVSAQPSLPIHRQDTIHLSDAEIEAAKAGIDATAPIKAYRFAEDRLCAARRFEALDARLNSDKTRIEFTTISGPGHAVFTLDFVDQEGHPTHQALTSILAYFDEQLHSSAQAAT